MVKRLRLHRRDRIFWGWLSRLRRGWRSSLIVFQPETVLRWHREGFCLYWRWKSRKRCGRPKLDAEIRVLIRRMSRDNPTWRRRRIHSELHLLGSALYLVPLTSPALGPTRYSKMGSRVRPSLPEARELVGWMGLPPSSPMPWSIRGPRAGEVRGTKQSLGKEDAM